MANKREEEDSGESGCPESNQRKCTEAKTSSRATGGERWVSLHSRILHVFLFTYFILAYILITVNSSKWSLEMEPILQSEAVDTVVLPASGTQGPVTELVPDDKIQTIDLSDEASLTISVSSAVSSETHFYY